MEAKLSGIATRVLQPLKELGEVQPYGIAGIMETSIRQPPVTGRNQQ